jgi:uroporphyrinogen-III synthase
VVCPGSESDPAVLKPLLSSTKIYVVGPATSKAIVQLGFSEQNVLGRHCGNGAALAEYILEDYNTRVPDGHKLPLLFLVGETRRDIIPKTLMSASENRRIALKELVVYETDVVHSFRDDFQAVMERTALGGADGDMPNARVVVVFSPAGADIAVDVLKGLKTECGTVLASIGPTTQERLEILGRPPDIVAKHPSPEGLWGGIANYMKLKERSVQVISDTA